MRRQFLLLVFLTGFFIAPQLTKAESIAGFNSQITINHDSSIAVSEMITYDFGTIPHHGILRDIPYHYQARGGNYNLGIRVTSVTDENGNPYPYTETTAGGEEDVKIGDPNAAITGLHTYTIDYTVTGAINYFSDHDELYWNITGNDWQVPMVNVAAGVKLPGSVSDSSVQLACFSGPPGSAAPCNSSHFTNGEAVFGQPTLAPGAGLTIVFGFPKGLVVQPTAWQNFIRIMRDNGVLAFPVAVLLAMWFLWYKKGRDPLGFKTIVPQYEAPKYLSPSEAGTILDETAKPKDISAEIINLAALGYIKITRLQDKILGFINHTDYRLDLLKDADDSLADFQRRLVTDIFGSDRNVKISQLKNTFYIHLKELSRAILGSLVKKGYFPRDPSKVKGLYVGLGSFVIVITIFIGVHGVLTFYDGLAFVLSGIIVMLFGYVMPQRTPKGAEAKQYILGLKMYLSVAEKDRLKFFNAPAATPERFEKLLPYAMVFGVENQWAKQFEGIYNQPPSWYYDPYGGPFNTFLFVGSLNNFSSAANTVLASRPGGAAGGGSGFGGGGFSGGGFGGGGGGSW